MSKYLNKTLSIGSTFLIDKCRYKVLAFNDIGCENCCFFKKTIFGACRAPKGLLCTSEERSDNKKVKFERINKTYNYEE